MKYKSLRDLINSSKSTRKYFLSLPVNIQLDLHKNNDYIHSAEDLHIHADLAEKQNHAVEISDYYG
ncbi:MAG: hypothetical protein LUF33_05585 [Clostridiales bacterium]|nr:hypothetical protein [Clostridiales bacterium]